MGKGATRRARDSDGRAAYFWGFIEFLPSSTCSSLGGRLARGRRALDFAPEIRRTSPYRVDAFLALCCDHLPGRGPEEAGDRAGTLRTRATNAPRRAVRARLACLR